jgi:hypothetical protein
MQPQKALKADLTETGKYGTIMHVGRSKLLFEVQMMNSPSFLLPRAFSFVQPWPNRRELVSTTKNKLLRPTTFHREGGIPANV